MTIRKTLVRRAAVAAALVATCTTAHAVPVTGDFACISGNSADCAAATSSLSWSWNGQDFTIANSGIGYVSEVYFDISSGMSVGFLSGTGIVNFYSGASPGALPAGNSVGFTSDRAFDSDLPGPTQWGINGGESATFRILGAALDSFTSGDLASGVHVRSLVTSSASLVTTTTATPVPEPGVLTLMFAGLAFLGFGLARRRRTD